MILDFKIRDVMRLSSIKRWGIIEMSRSQSVAEHSYNVAMISIEILSNMGMRDSNLLSDAMYWSLVHDLPELVTGDMPTPIKPFIDFYDMEQSLFPKYKEAEEDIEEPLVKKVVKAADFVEALQFAEKFCVDSRKQEVMEDIRSNLGKHLEHQRDIAAAIAKMDLI